MSSSTHLIGPQKLATLPETLRLNTAFAKKWGTFSAYSFLDEAWTAVLQPLSKAPDILKNGLIEFVHWIDEIEYEIQKLASEQRMRAGLPYTIQFSLLVNGQIIALEEVGFLVEDELSEGATIKGVLRNITQQQIVYDEMEQQRLFYEGTLNKMPVELVVLDTSQRYLFCNRTAIKSDELREWLIGKSDLDYCLFRGKDPKTVAIRQAYFQQAISSRSEVEWEEVQKNDHNETDHSLKRYSPILGPDGEILIVIGYGFNITDIRRAEQRAKLSDELIRSLTENVQEGIFRFSSEGELLFANNAFYSLFSKEIAHKLRTSHQDAETKALATFLLTGEIDETAPLSVWIQEQSSSWLISRRETEDHAYRDGVIVDVSGLKAIQSDLEVKNKELEKAYMELDRFVYSASHDLRAPLTSVLGIIKVMEAEKELGIEIEESLPYVSMIKTSVERLDVFVKEIIQYYRNNRTTVENKEIDFKTHVGAIYEMIRHLRPDSVVDLQVEDTFQGLLKIDSARLTIILNNLISNAVKYHHDTGGYVRCILRQLGDKIEIRVEDNGPGIDPNHHDRLFDMFYRVGVDSSGSGLGLYIVNETVKKLNGSITLESRLGLGTSFIVTLPSVT